MTTRLLFLCALQMGSEQTCCRKGGRRKEGGGRSQASGRSGRQSGKTTVVSCRWVLVPFSQLWCSFVLYQNCEQVPSMQHACCVQQCRFSDHMWYQCGLSCKRAKTYETLAIFYTFFTKSINICSRHISLFRCASVTWWHLNQSKHLNSLWRVSGSSGRECARRLQRTSSWWTRAYQVSAMLIKCFDDLMWTSICSLTWLNVISYRLWKPWG